MFKITNLDNLNESPAFIAISGVDSIEEMAHRIAESCDNSRKPAFYFFQNMVALGETFWVDVENSSLVERIGFNFKSNVLTVDLTSGRYTYPNRSPLEFLQFIGAPSKGTFFNRVFKNGRR